MGFPPDTRPRHTRRKLLLRGFGIAVHSRIGLRRRPNKPTANRHPPSAVMIAGRGGRDRDLRLQISYGLYLVLCTTWQVMSCLDVVMALFSMSILLTLLLCCFGGRHTVSLVLPPRCVWVSPQVRAGACCWLLLFEDRLRSEGMLQARGRWHCVFFLEHGVCTLRTLYFRGQKGFILFEG